MDVAHAGIVALGPAAVKRRGVTSRVPLRTCPAVLRAIYDGRFDGVISFAAVIDTWRAFFQRLCDEEGLDADPDPGFHLRPSRRERSRLGLG